MSEKIVKIHEVEGVKVNLSSEGWRISMGGYVIETTEQKIELLIMEDQLCCEDWGYITSEDDFSDFIGAEILSIKNVDSALKVTEATLSNHYVEVDNCIFINVETTKGTLQFTLYNQHNGYYSHKYMIRSTQLTDSGYL